MKRRFLPLRTQKPPVQPLWLRFWQEWQRLDKVLFFLVVGMVLAGVLVAYSTTVPFALTRTEYRDAYYFFKRHLLFVTVGFVSMMVLAFLDYRRLLQRRYLLLVTTGLLGLLFFVDVRNLVSDTPGRTLFVGMGSVQPGEFVKPLLVVYLAAWLARRRPEMEAPGKVWWYGGWIIAVFTLLLVLQPDLSAAGTAVMLGLMMLLLSGATWRQALAALATLAVVVAGGLRLAMAVYPPAQHRIRAYLVVWEDPTAVEGHIRQAFYAFIRGGWFGQGPGASRGKVFTLPLPHTDSVFAVIGEEWGVVGALVVLVLFTLLLWRGLWLAAQTSDSLGRLLAAGLTLWLVTEAFIHMGGMVGFLPQAGNALPFFSYGGSNLVASMLSVGLLLSIARVGRQAQEASSYAVAHMHRRHGRGRVSRAGRVSTAS